MSENSKKNGGTAENPAAEKPRRKGSAQLLIGGGVEREMITGADAAKRLKIPRQNVERMAQRHGVRKNGEGKYCYAELLAAHRAGKMLNKDALAAQMSAIPEDMAADDYPAQKLALQVRKLQAEVDMLDLELGEKAGGLVEVKVIRDVFRERFAHMAAQLSVVGDTMAAKNPKHVEIINEMTAKQRAVILAQLEE